MHDLFDQLHEIRFESNRKIALVVLTYLEQFGVSLPQFLEGLALILDERQQSQPAMHLERAAEVLNKINQIKE
jgi:hypothetical protein